MTGDYPHKKLAATLTAPKGARWFQLGFGLRSCTGWASFNDIDIQTRPGEPEAEVKRVLPIDPAQFTWTPCDLTKLFNRPLADDVDNDGKGGWTDQGPLMDLRNLQAGEYIWNNVAFRVEKGNACFIMKNKHPPAKTCPTAARWTSKARPTCWRSCTPADKSPWCLSPLLVRFVCLLARHRRSARSSQRPSGAPAKHSATHKTPALKTAMERRGGFTVRTLLRQLN